MGLTDTADDEFQDLKAMIEVTLSWRSKASDGRPLMFV